jgi:hypothetical protein
MQSTSDIGDHSTLDGSFSRDVEMNAIPSINDHSSGQVFDSCGYEEGVILSVDSRNLKW